MGADDTDTGSFTAPTRPAGPTATSKERQPATAAGDEALGNPGLDTATSASANRPRRSSPMMVDSQDGNESTASTCKFGRWRDSGKSRQKTIQSS